LKNDVIISRKTFFKFFFVGLLKVNDENRRIRIRISQRHGSADPDPHQNVMDPMLSRLDVEIKLEKHVEKTGKAF
jgi:hypothetical protein